MTAHDEIDKVLGEFLARTTHVRRWLMLQGDDQQGSFGKELSANVRGWSIVWMCAASESYWSSLLQIVCTEVSVWSRGRHRKKLRAQSIYFAEKFFAPASKELDTRWERAASLLKDVATAERVGLGFTIPYDGKTVRPRHLELVWKVFELDGAPFVSFVHKQSLETLAVDRNKIAHGESLPATIGALRPIEDVTATLSRLEASMEHVSVELKRLF